MLPVVSYVAAAPSVTFQLEAHWANTQSTPLHVVQGSVLEIWVGEGAQRSRVTLTPHIAGDGTITVAVVHVEQGVAVIHRFKLDEEARLALPEGTLLLKVSLRKD